MSTSVTTLYDTEGNFTHNNTLTEFSGSVVRLKDLSEAGVTFAHAFAELDASYGGGSLTAVVKGITPTIDASTTAGRLDCDGTSVEALHFVNSADNLAATQTGTIDLIFAPAYTGTPAGTRTLFSAGNSAGGNTNLLAISHLITTGKLRFHVYDSSGVQIFDFQSTFAWAPVAGTEYRIQCSWDLDTGANRMFVDGIQLATADTSTGTRTTTDLNVLCIGTNPAGTGIADGTFGSVRIWSTVQNTANYTVGAEATTQYSRAAPTVVLDAAFTTDNIEAFTESISETGNATCQYTFIDSATSIEYYWNSSAWVAADGTYAQSNTAEVVNTNGSHTSFPEGDIQLKAYFYTDYGKTRAELTSNTYTYSFYNTQTTPTTCTVWGFYRDVSGVGVSGASVEFTLVRDSKQYMEAGSAIIDKKVTVTTDANGRFEAELVRSSGFESGGTYYVRFYKTTDGLETKLTQAGTKIEITVPDSTTQNITGLITSVG